MANEENRGMRSGDPSVRAAASRPTQPQSKPRLSETDITSPSAWVSKEGRGDAEVIVLPSGNKAKVRRAGPEAFLSQGLIPDKLTPIVEKAIHSKKGLRPEKQKELLEDPKALGSMIEMLDRTLCYAVLDPIVVMPPACEICGELDIQAATQHSNKEMDSYHEFIEDSRRDDILYADRVDFDDKMFIMNFCIGGTRDLEQFRRETGSAMASLSDSQIVSDETE